MTDQRKYTTQEVARIIEVVGQHKVYNSDVSEDDVKLIESVGYRYGSVDNGHGGYTYLEYQPKETTT